MVYAFSKPCFWSLAQLKHPKTNTKDILCCPNSTVPPNQTTNKRHPLLPAAPLYYPISTKRTLQHPKHHQRNTVSNLPTGLFRLSQTKKNGTYPNIRCCQVGLLLLLQHFLPHHRSPRLPLAAGPQRSLVCAGRPLERGAATAGAAAARSGALRRGGATAGGW